jgi:hypothetical protein
MRATKYPCPLVTERPNPSACSKDFRLGSRALFQGTELALLLTTTAFHCQDVQRDRVRAVPTAEPQGEEGQRRQRLLQEAGLGVFCSQGLDPLHSPASLI